MDDVYVEDAVRPYEGDKLSFGILTEDGGFELVSTKMLIVGSEPSDDGAVLSLTEYNEDVYRYGTLPEYKSNITPRPESSLLSLEDVRPYAAPSDVAAAIGQLNAGTAEIDAPDTITYLEAIAKKNEISLEWAPLGVGLKNTVQYYEVDYSTDNGETWENAGISKTNSMAFIIDREKFGYPEASDFATWQFRVIAASIYSKRSEDYKTARVNVSQYGTWKLAKPSVYARVNNRTVTMILSQPERSDGKEVYGTLNYKVSVKRPDIDTVWFKPATDADPYADEFNYKTEPGYIESSSPYVQYMPLKGQNTENIEDTLYMFRFSAYTEAEESEAVEKTALTACGEIRDLVKAKETAKEAYITELSTLSANVGTITQGAFGNNNNIWDLSTFRDDKGFQHYEGLFHVGGGSQYLHVDPVLVNGHPTGEYTIAFKVGAFEISADASNINGELIIQYNDKSLDRTRITQTGTFYEHRETVDSPWREIASDTVNGVKTQQVFSEHNLVITNQTMTERRFAGTDIGNPYLSEDAKVYHFDENLNDQKGESELVINGNAGLVGSESSGVIDFTPAILAISPYSTVCKSVYGQFSATIELEASNIWTVDFWTQYIYAENQILFAIGNDFDKIKMTVQAAEAFYNDLDSPDTTEDDNFFYSYETAESQLYTKLLPETLFYNEDSLPYNERDSMEPYYNKKAVKEWAENYIYFQKNQNGFFVPVNVSVWEYDDSVIQELYEEDCVYNEIEEAQSYISHEGINGKESVSLKALGIDLKDNMWLHVGIVSTEETLAVYMDHKQKTFEKYSFARIENTVILNEGKTSFVLDELYIDNETAESYETFCEHTQNRIPWGALDKNNQHFILEYDQESRLITNIFDSDLFKSKVLELINSNE